MLNKQQTNRKRKTKLRKQTEKRKPQPTKRKKKLLSKPKKDKEIKDQQLIDDANEQAVNEAIDEHENGKENTDSEDTSFAIKQAEIEYAKVTK